jgi:hypothetical protein
MPSSVPAPQGDGDPETKPSAGIAFRRGGVVIAGGCPLGSPLVVLAVYPPER